MCLTVRSLQVISNFQALSAHQRISEQDEVSRLVKQVEEQRRQIESLNRELKNEV